MRVRVRVRERGRVAGRVSALVLCMCMCGGYLPPCTQNIVKGSHASDGDIKRLRKAIDAARAHGTDLMLVDECEAQLQRVDTEVRHWGLVVAT